MLSPRLTKDAALGTYLERHDRRDVFDESRDLENHIGRVTVLFHRAVDLLNGVKN